MLETLTDIGAWLNSTDLHFWARDTLRGNNWVSPLIQSIHIVSVAAVIGAIGVIDLRILGLAARSQAPSEMASRLLPWLWTALVLLALTGFMLILNRPPRYLDNAAFLAKMLMLATAVILTLLLSRGLRRGDDYWFATPARLAAGRTLAGASVALWVGVILAGRWIAYV